MHPKKLLLLTLLGVSLACARDLPLEQIELPHGFEITIYSDNVPNARSMVLSPQGIVFVGTRRDGRVYALRDNNNDYRVDKVFTVASGLDMPNGVDFRQGALYVAENSRVIRFDDIENRLDSPPDPVVVNDSFPQDEHHGWKYMRFGPDDKLYVPVGAPCNICNPDNPVYATIMRMNADGSDLHVYAKGIRNTVGFDWHPKTNELWFTDNGRDWMGDNRPPDELNRAWKKGLHFGYPFWHGGDIPDPEYGELQPKDEFVPPVQGLGPHVAALGMLFYEGEQFPKEYQHQVLIAEHGSWNRTDKIGYRVMMVTLNGNKALEYKPFAQGWLQGEQAWGRPVDVIGLPDGSILVSDDRAGAIYRISYRE
ncbi:sorbosone dehydrogenase family protein [candidate division KSB1 bacterium]|nr:sorbosone dehydrogenase family protein [candidate division KSB1 bacterium]